MCTVDCRSTTCMWVGASTICLHSIKSSLPFSPPLRHSHDKSSQALSRFSVLQAMESWTGPGNKASESPEKWKRVWRSEWHFLSQSMKVVIHESGLISEGMCASVHPFVSFKCGSWERWKQAVKQFYKQTVHLCIMPSDWNISSLRITHSCDEKCRSEYKILALFPGSPLTLSKNKNRGGIDLHMISRHNDVTAIIAKVVMELCHVIGSNSCDITTEKVSCDLGRYEWLCGMKDEHWQIWERLCGMKDEHWQI